jgi:phosphate transport system substrate-binding protein
VIGVAIWAATRPPDDTADGQPNSNPAPAANPQPVPPTPGPTPEKRLALKAGGSTFIAPVMQLWTPRYEKQTGVKVEYEPVGSSKGVRKLIDREYAVGLTDAPLTDAELSEARGAGGEVLHVPLVIAPVAVAYNLPGVKEPVKFTGPVLALIYLGKITRWNDERLTAKNPDLPDLPITVVHRAEGSGTTFVWTEYLGKASPEWREQPRVGNVIEWPAGEPAKGNDGVAALVGRKAGAIGYVELTAARANNLAVGLVQNQEGEFTDPRDPAGVTAAATTFLPTIRDDLRFSLTDAPGRTSYPIVGTTWAVLYATQPAAAGPELVKFLRWAVHDGQSDVVKQKGAPLPGDLVARIDAKLDRVTAGR